MREATGSMPARKSMSTSVSARIIASSRATRGWSRATRPLLRWTASPGATVVPGAVHQKIGSYILTNSSATEDIRVQTLNIGISGAAGNLGNFSAYVGTTQLGSTIGQLYPNPALSGLNLIVPAGASVTLDLYADFASSSHGLYATSLVATGVGASTDTFYQSSVAVGQTVTVVGYQGSFAVATNPALGNQNVPSNATRQKIGSFLLQAGPDEGVRVTNLNLTLIVSGTSLSNLNNLSVSDNTTPVQPMNANNFPVNFVIPAGSTHEVDVYADLGALSAGSTILTKLGVSAIGAATDVSLLANGNGAIVTGQTITVAPSVPVGGSLTVATNPALGNQNVSPNATQQKIGSFLLQAGPNEGVRVTNLNLALTVSGTSLSNLNNLYVSDNTTLEQPMNVNNFPVNFTIPANSTHEVDVYAALSGAVPSGSTILTKLSVNAMGATTFAVLPANGNGAAVTGQTVTVVAQPAATAGTLWNNTLPAADQAACAAGIGNVTAYDNISIPCESEA